MSNPTVCKKRCDNYQQKLIYILILTRRIKARAILGSEVAMAVYGSLWEHSVQDGQEEL